jgi:hypothetical protein
METQQYSPFMLINADEAVNNKIAYSVAMDLQQRIPFALLFSWTTFRPAVNTSIVLIVVNNTLNYIILNLINLCCISLQANHISSGPYCGVTCDLSGCTVFFRIIKKCTIFFKKNY